MLDAPLCIEQQGNKEAWCPENYNKEKSGGPSTLRIGIEKSRNQMTVRLHQDMGMPLITEYSKRFGMTCCQYCRCRWVPARPHCSG